MDGFDGELLKRLPLAHAAVKLWAWAIDPALLDALFAQHRGRTYERELTFAALVGLILDALTEHGGSGRQSFERAREQGRLEISNGSVYEKLGRLPVALAQGFLADASARLAEVLPLDIDAVVLPGCLDEFRVMVVDGKVLKHVERRMKVVRRRQGKITGGKALMALDLRQGLVVAMEADLNGNRNDVPLVPPLVAQVRQQGDSPILWIKDAQFCDLNQPVLLSQGSDHFLIRYSGNVSFEADPSRPSGRGTDKAGRPWVEQWGWLGGKDNPRRVYVRRITLQLQDGKQVAVVTDLLDAQAYPAAELLEAYGQRWGIERVFQQVTEVFALKELIGSTPQATLFQGAFCMVLYNMIQVVRAYAARDGKKEVRQVSTEQLFYDMRRDMAAWHQTSGPGATMQTLKESAAQTAAQLREMLSRTLKGIWTNRWIKSPSTRHTPRKLDIPMPPSGRTAIWTAIEAAKRRSRSKQTP